MLENADKLVKQIYDSCMIHKLLRPGMRLVVGVSGGADSVCLLKVLNELREPLNLDIICVHIEHGIRGEESRRDLEFVKKLCDDLDVKLHIYEKDVPAFADEMSMSLEEAGRYIRYEAFGKELEKNGADAIAVAHHMGDQVETVIFNMIRGSGLKGLSGMSYSHDKIIRPLLDITRDQIEDYLARIGQDYCIDSTNYETGYSRNNIRNTVIPELEKTVKGASYNIARAAAVIGEADDFIRGEAGKVFDAAVAGEDGIYVLDIPVITEYPPIIRKYVVRMILTGLYRSLKDLESMHVDLICGLLDKQSGRSVDLPGDIIAKREGDRILAGSRNKLAATGGGFEKVLETDGETVIPGHGHFVSCIDEYKGDEAIPDGLYTKWFDYDKIKNSVLARNRLCGDYLTVGTDGGRKKLKSYLIDEKVPASKRDDIIVLADGSHIIWVLGMRISEYYKIGADTKKVLKVSYFSEEKE